MAINYEKLLAWSFEDVEQTYSKRDTMLYALGLGFGADPCDREQLKFVFENGLQALPSMAVVLGYPGFWISHPDTGVDATRLVHGEQSVAWHQPLPVEGTVVGRTSVREVIDKGEGKGALVLTQREVFDKASGDKLCTQQSTTFCRADGGFGGPSGPAPKPHVLPQTEPDLHVDFAILPQAALIYRLSGDYNPLHADPQLAEKAGFRQPILHGLCTFGMAGHAILKSCCGYQTDRLKSLQVRFSAPVYPGETLRTEIWRQGSECSFRARVLERDLVVLNNGRAELG
ncbi:MAG: MaoC family dehydratase N-terminal domain-containing protein [Gammaproteobacteria bacterium]|nr:MaoC family dehydratase N-terminal domain-containing protein [Gammaproteobacteria bacterium]